MSKKEFVEITCLVRSSDDLLFTEMINQGIDSRLEAFTKSEFSVRSKKVGDVDCSRRVLNFHVTELPLLVRRLEERGDDFAQQWADDIRELEEFPKGTK